MVTFIKAIDLLFQLLEVLIIIRIFMGLLRISFDNFIGKLIYELTEPILAPSRMLLNKLGLGGGVLDFSPWISIISLRLIYALIVNLLM